MIKELVRSNYLASETGLHRSVQRWFQVVGSYLVQLVPTVHTDQYKENIVAFDSQTSTFWMRFKAMIQIQLRAQKQLSVLVLKSFSSMWHKHRLKIQPIRSSNHFSNSRLDSLRPPSQNQYSIRPSNYYRTQTGSTVHGKWVTKVGEC